MELGLTPVVSVGNSIVVSPSLLASIALIHVADKEIHPGVAKGIYDCVTHANRSPFGLTSCIPSPTTKFNQQGQLKRLFCTPDGVEMATKGRELV